MPEGPDGKTIIIVKKVSGHGGHHGGAWKVAYADFVTAMMALFMVLWLVNSASITTRERIASYFREPGVFEKGSGTPLEEGGAGILDEAFSPPADENVRATHSKKIYKVESSKGRLPDAFDTSDGEGPGRFTVENSGGEKSDFETIKRAIEKIIEEEKKKGRDMGKIEIKVDQRGLHIEIMDTEKASMFELGSSRISEVAEEELTKIAVILSALPNPIDIEGHTDGRPYRSADNSYDNWNLSADRANTARRVLLKSGISEKQFARVVGYADQRLKFPGEPLADGNRRISISMRYTELANKALEATGERKAVTEPKEIAPVNPKPAEPEPEPEQEAPKTEIKEPPPEFRSIQAAATPAPQVPADQSRGLRVEVGTTAPEGEPIYERDADTGGTWMEKDKIFGNKNPFFGGE